MGSRGRPSPAGLPACPPADPPSPAALSPRPPPTELASGVPRGARPCRLLPRPAARAGSRAARWPAQRAGRPPARGRRTWTCTCVPGTSPGYPRVSSDPPPVSPGPFPGAHLCPQAPLAPARPTCASRPLPGRAPVPPARPTHAVGLSLRGALLAAGSFDGVFLKVGTRISAPPRPRDRPVPAARAPCAPRRACMGGG